eukprot:5199182-Amphidinium_carterae.1
MELTVVEWGFSQAGILSGLCCSCGIHLYFTWCAPSCEDVLRLYCCLAVYDKELFAHINALGFHLQTVFYSAFMQLFSFHLPTNTLFRSPGSNMSCLRSISEGFWDILFGETAKKHPAHRPARHTLIDLAYAALTKNRAVLLRCESAQEAKSAVLDYLEHMHNATMMVESLAEAEDFLWNHITHEAGSSAAGSLMGFSPKQSQEFEMVVHWYAAVSYTHLTLPTILLV